MPELVSPLQVVPAEILALLFLVSAVSQFGFIATGAWLFQEPDERLTRRKGLDTG